MPDLGDNVTATLDVGIDPADLGDLSGIQCVMTCRGCDRMFRRVYHGGRMLDVPLACPSCGGVDLECAE